jgi:uncharacterized protein
MTEIRRSSWGVILGALTFPTLITWIYFVALKGSPAGIQQGAYSVGKLVQFVFPIIWVWRTKPQELAAGIFFLRRFFRFSGDARPSQTRQLRGSDIGIGLAFGLFIGLAAWALYTFGLKPMGLFTAAQEQVRAKVSGMGIDSLGKYAALGLFYALFHSFLEEYYWRWFVFREVRSRCALIPAMIISGTGFMLHHIIVLATFFGWYSPATWLFSLCVAVGGMFWGWLYERSQSLVGPWMSHCLVDAAIFLVGYDLIRDVLQ